MPGKNAGQRHRERMAQRSREQSKATAEIGPLPKVVNPRRKKACEKNLLKFLIKYFPNSTGLKPFSEDHKEMIARLQHCILKGGKMIKAVFRGYAKTTIGENACIWAACYGHREFLVLIGADKDACKANLESIKAEFETNELLYEDFPEICHPIVSMEGRNQRAATQTLDGELTRIGWTADEIVLPTVAGAKSSSVCIKPQSLMACSRGMKHKHSDGRQVRPDFVFVDDPQTDESARTPGQVQKRDEKLKRTVLKLAGHNKQLAVYIAATIIEKDDLVHRLLDPQQNHQFQGSRSKMVLAWSDVHETMWLDEYASIRKDYDRDLPGDKERAELEATKFYRKNRKKMDSGCEVTWKYCFDEACEISAIQHAYNALIDDGPDVFAAEYQNEPPERLSASVLIETENVLDKAIGPKRGIVPSWASHVVAFIDIQQTMLWYVVAAFSDEFDGCIVQYGTTPEQGRIYYTKSDSKKTFASTWPDDPLETQIWNALDLTTRQLLGRKWKREDGADMDIEMCLIDEGFKTPTIYEFCKRSEYASRIMPAKGDAIGAKKKPFEDYQKRKGETLGEHWRRVKVVNGSTRHVIHNPNHWKTFVWNRILSPVGSSGSMLIYKDSSNRHAMYADHIAKSEVPNPVTANGRTVDEWEETRLCDNDLFDCTTGVCIAASMMGCKLRISQNQHKSTGKKKRRRVTGAWAS